MELNYTEHNTLSGKSYKICCVDDVHPNTGGLYCEIYDVTTDDVIDFVVVHKGDNPDDVVKSYMDENYPIGKRFDDMTKDELWKLRQEIILNSLYVYHYDNTFGFDERDISYFFDGYVDYINELLEDDVTGKMTFEELDNPDTLEQWFNCNDDLSWVKNI